MKILIIGATHGNELLGVKLYQRLLYRRSPLLENIDFIVGNPRAFAQRKRYIERDLNRSYQGETNEYEVQRAQVIHRYIDVTKPDIVLDMHTTTCNQPSCIIVSNLEGTMKKRMLRASHLTNVLQVQPMGDILALGNNILGYEVSNRKITVALLDEIIGDLQRFVDDMVGIRTKKIYTIRGKIYKHEITLAQASTLVNFERHLALDYVPVLVGENSYKKQTDYLGFKANSPYEVEV